MAYVAHAYNLIHKQNVSSTQKKQSMSNKYKQKPSLLTVTIIQN